MSCTYPKDELVVEVPQNTARGYAFTIKQNVYNADTQAYEPQTFDLTEWTINFYVKPAPYYSIEPLITKTITTTSDITTQGQITDATNGQFTVQILQTDTQLPPNDYYLIIEMVNGPQVISLSNDGNYKSVFRVLTQ